MLWFFFFCCVLLLTTCSRGQSQKKDGYRQNINKKENRKHALSLAIVFVAGKSEKEDVADVNAKMPRCPVECELFFMAIASQAVKVVE